MKTSENSQNIILNSQTLERYSTVSDVPGAKKLHYMIEQGFKEAIDRWVKDACPMGSFVNACLENDLKEAIGRADEDAYLNLRDIIKYLYNEVPGMCWGSEERVKAWREKKRISNPI